MSRHPETYVSVGAQTTLHQDAAGQWTIGGPFGNVRINEPRLSAAIRGLQGDGSSDRALMRLAGEHAALFFYHLELATDMCLLEWTLMLDGASLLTLVPLSPYAGRRMEGYVEEAQLVQLSPFVSARPTIQGLVVESPLRHAHVRFRDARLGRLLVDLSHPNSALSLADRFSDFDPSVLRGVLQMFWDGGMLVPFPPSTGEAANRATSVLRTPVQLRAAALRQWEPHDLTFHVASRRRRPALELGATFRFEDEIPPPPVRCVYPWEHRIPLSHPDLNALQKSDPLFVEVVERRRSNSVPRSKAITLPVLAELLFRAARVRAVKQAPGGDVTDRTYPGAGARYELEVYPVVHRCDGLPSGLYHYDPHDHQLAPISELTADARSLLETAGAVSAVNTPPDVLLVISARFQRLAWKYESIAYSLILKDTGVLLHHIGLTAAAMSLSACPLGWGDPEVFARATGLDPFIEGSVGEIALNG